MKITPIVEHHLSQLNPSDRRALLIVSVFLLLVGGYVFVIEPLMFSYQDANNAITELTDKQRRYRRQVTLLPRRESKLAEYTAERKAIERRFNLQVGSPEEAVSITITELTYYARLADIVINGIRPLDPINSGDFLEIPFEVEAIGEYENLRIFFYYIDTSPSLLAITDLDLLAKSEGLHHAKLKLSNIASLQSKEIRDVAGAIEPQNRLRLLLSYWTGYAPLVIAKANGYLDTDSLQVDLLQIDDNVTRLRLLASGEADVIGTTLPALLDYWVSGIPLSVVFPLNSTVGTEGIVVRPDSNIKTVVDLQYQSVAADKHGLLHYTLFQALEANGMSLADVELKSLAASQVARDMSNGTLEIGVTRDPYLSALVNNNLARLIYASEDNNGLILDLLAVTTEAAENKPEAIQLMINGLRKASQFIDEQPERAIEIVSEWQGQPIEVTRISFSKLSFYDDDATRGFFAEDQLTGLLNKLEDYFDAINRPFPLLTRKDIINSIFFDKSKINTKLQESES